MVRTENRSDWLTEEYLHTVEVHWQVVILDLYYQGPIDDILGIGGSVTSHRTLVHIKEPTRSPHRSLIENISMYSHGNILILLVFSPYSLA